MMLRSLGLTAVLAATLTACASAPPEPNGGRRGPGGSPGRDGPAPPPSGPQLFISPAGEPFRVPAGAPYPVATWFQGADANHDGALTRDEFVADALRFFAIVDANHDGVIDGFEVSTYENHIAPEIIGGAAPGAMRRGPRGLGEGQEGGPDDIDMSPGRRRPQGANVLQGASLFGLIAEPQPVMAADADFNRRITKDEMTKASKTRFTLLDINKDGVLRLEELPKTPAQLGGRPGARGDGAGPSGSKMGGRGPGGGDGGGRRG